VAARVVQKRFEEDARAGSVVDEPDRVGDRLEARGHHRAHAHVTHADQSARVSHRAAAATSTVRRVTAICATRDRISTAGPDP